MISMNQMLRIALDQQNSVEIGRSGTLLIAVFSPFGLAT